MGTARTREEHLKRATGSFELVDDSARAARAAGAVDSASLDDMRSVSPARGALSPESSGAVPRGSAAAPSSVPAQPKAQTNNPRVRKAQAEAEAARAASAQVARNAQAGAGGKAEAGTEAADKAAVESGRIAKKAAAKPVSDAEQGAPSPVASRTSSARPSVARSKVARPKPASVEKPEESEGPEGPEELGKFGEPVNLNELAHEGASSASAGASSPAARRRARRAAKRESARAAAESEQARPRRGERPARSRGLVAVLAIVGVLVALAVAVTIAFSAFRWVTCNDVQDFQGTWYVNGTDTTVAITEDSIRLNDEVSYWYELNTDAKTVAFTFSYLEGAGHYRFSLDRQQLAIVDGNYGWWDTLLDDAVWTVGALFSLAQGTQLDPAQGAAEGVTSLTRASDAPSAPDVSDAPEGEVAVGETNADASAV